MFRCKFILRFFSSRHYPWLCAGTTRGCRRTLDPAVSVCSSPVTPFDRKMKGAAHSGRLRVRECSVGGHFRNMSPEVRYLFPETSLTSLPLTHTRMVMSVVSSSQRALIEKSVSSVLNDDS